MTDQRLAELQRDPRVAARLHGGPLANTATTILAAYRAGLLTPAEVDAYIDTCLRAAK